MKYYTICFKKAKVHQKDRDSLDLLKNCSENFTDVIDNKKYSGADFIKGKILFLIVRWLSPCYSAE